MAVKVKDARLQPNLFEQMKVEGEWRPEEALPDLSRFKDIWLDPENDGKGRLDSQPCGFAVATPERSWYIPFGHKEGGNLDPDKVKEWARRELRGKRITNIAMGLDAQTVLNWGVDLEAQGCALHDISHTAALLNENRFKAPNLHELGMECLGRGKSELKVHPSRIHEAHSSQVGPYAMTDVELARDIDLFQRPLAEADGLGEVEALEDELIWANNHMEREGARMDRPKLESWVSEVAEEHAGIIMRIWAETGVKLRPSAATSWHELFEARGLKKPHYGKFKEKKNAYGMFLEDKPEGYTDEFLKGVKDEYVEKGLRARRLESLDSKYLSKYLKAIGKGDRLPFKLYQLRATEDDKGTVVGRYSSADVNIQQVFKPGNQVKRFGEGFIIRELFLPEDGLEAFAADGSQLQFRLFAHYSKDAELVRRYNEDPDVDFHDMVASLFSLDRQAAKHNNFAMVLGMGREKLANRLGMSCTCRETIHWAMAKLTRGNPNVSAEERRQYVFAMNENHAHNCPARASNDLADRYDAQFPAAKNTMKAVTKLCENRGFTRTLSGRRRRFKTADGKIINEKFYSGFATLLQGSEADVVKKKIITLYRNMATLGIARLRFPVHDEIVGDNQPDPVLKRRMQEALAEQEWKLRVPIVWNCGFGPNWAAASADA